MERMEKLNIYRKKNDVFNDAIDQVVINLYIQKEKSGYRSFTICGCEPGNGNTSVAINLAVALAEAGWSTVLVDGDMRKKHRYKRLSEKTTLGLSDYLLGRAEQMKEILYETTTDNLYYVPCGKLIDHPIRVLCANRMNELKRNLTREFDFVLFDMPAVNASMDANVMAVRTDVTILVVALGETSKDGFTNAVSSMRSDGVKILWVLANKTRVDEYRRYRKDYDYFSGEHYVHKANQRMHKNARK